MKETSRSNQKYSVRKAKPKKASNRRYPVQLLIRLSCFLAVTMLVALRATAQDKPAEGTADTSLAAKKVEQAAK